MNVFNVLKDRGFVYQATDEDAIRTLFDRGRVTAYIGFDPTANSLHAGSLIPIMALAHLQREGHRPIALVGGGTGLVGDPSGKTESRKLLNVKDIRRNAEALKVQFSRYISFEKDSALLLNNADWLVGLNYIEFLRDIGKHFSVNKMLSAESIKQRLEKGLTFIEFNYMVLQAYDFYILNRDYDCDLQMGGQDQWGNIVAGIDLTRRIASKEAYGLTFPLITDANGEKFGKSVKGAVWLDDEKTSSYDYYQFFRNTMDSDVERYLGYFTFLPMEEVHTLARLKPPLLNRAKEILAYEATLITHGIQSARNAYIASVDKFGESDRGKTVDTSSSILEVEGSEAEHPAVEIDAREIEKGLSVLDAFVNAGLCTSKGEARRLIRQGGAYVEDKRIDDENFVIGKKYLSSGEINLRAGKKRHMRIQIVTRSL
ncbi:MAG: tyrosyl-tRNA synthetase [Spirochaetes bacterium DG_61]|nr:MAG: tyrosyl-tRNA synthetase [Spirochaetes bacterium DG_61]